MNIFRSENFNFDYNKFMNRLTITKGNEWISLSITSFNIFLNIVENSSSYERVIIRQNGSDVEVTCLMKNYNLTLTCKNFTTFLNFSELEGNLIRENIKIIKENLHKLKSIAIDGEKKNEVPKNTKTKMITQTEHKKRRLNYELKKSNESSAKRVRNANKQIFESKG